MTLGDTKPNGWVWVHRANRCSNDVSRSPHWCKRYVFCDMISVSREQQPPCSHRHPQQLIRSGFDWFQMISDFYNFWHLPLASICPQPAQVPFSVVLSPITCLGECSVSRHEFDPTYKKLVFLEPPSRTDRHCHAILVFRIHLLYCWHPTSIYRWLTFPTRRLTGMVPNWYPRMTCCRTQTSSI